MDLAFSDEQQAIRDDVLKLCRHFGDDNRLVCDQDGEWPHEFHKAFAEAGYLGIAMPESFEGPGLGIAEGGIMTEALSESGGAGSAAACLNKYLYGLNPIAVFGTEDQKRCWTPPMIKGLERNCFATTERDSGLKALALKARAERDVTLDALAVVTAGGLNR